MHKIIRLSSRARGFLPRTFPVYFSRPTLCNSHIAKKWISNTPVLKTVGHLSEQEKAHSGTFWSPLRYKMYGSSRVAPYPTRTHTCGSLTAQDEGCHVVLMGWLLPERFVLEFYLLQISQ